jgi:DNA replication protein DnaC
MTPTKNQALEICLKDLRLSAILEEYGRQAISAEKNHWSYPQYLLSLTSMEGEARRVAKINRNRLASKLPGMKTKANLDLELFSPALRKRFADLCSGQFITKSENILAFGLPGVGKTHYLCAIAHELISQGF